MTETQYYRPTKAIVDLAAIQHNVQSLRNFLKEETVIMAVVKADGYGHGITEVGKAALEAGAKMLSVATPDEAIELRKAGIESDILVMAPVPPSFAKVASDLMITVTISDASWLKTVLDGHNDIEKPIKVHVKIDSGMGRVGVREENQLQEIIEVLEGQKIFELDGVFTHFSSADDGVRETTAMQCEKFSQLIALFPTKPRLVHVSNSAATLLYPEYGFDAVRFGISLYGIAPSSFVEQQLPFQLESALSIETELTFVKQVEINAPISYGGTYTSTKAEWIGTIPIGYADGLKRGLRGQEVLIDGQRMPIVGTICMDQCMIKLPKSYPVGEKVVLIGNQGNEEVTIEEWADRIDSIPYEIAVSISKRVPRIYKN